MTATTESLISERFTPRWGFTTALTESVITVEFDQITPFNAGYAMGQIFPTINAMSPVKTKVQMTKAELKTQITRSLINGWQGYPVYKALEKQLAAFEQEVSGSLHVNEQT